MKTKETTPVGRHHRTARKRPSASKKAAQLEDRNDRRFEFGKKFAVLIYGEHRQHFRLFASKRDALFLYFRAGYAFLSDTPLRDVHGKIVKILGARLYQVYCDDEELARDRIARGNALRIHDTFDPCAGRELVVSGLFRTIQRRRNGD
jgi:hypothetical protein